MARGLKTAGLEEIRAIKRRVLRQHAMGRISRPDREYLIGLIDLFEARVIRMSEKGNNIEEEGF